MKLDLMNQEVIKKENLTNKYSIKNLHYSYNSWPDYCFQKGICLLGKADSHSILNKKIK